MKETSIVISKGLRLTALLLMAAMALALAGCTHNNGDIGPIFGQWQLRSITPDTDGAQPPALPEDAEMYWAFQSSTVRVDLCLPRHEVRSSYGNYRLTDETLFLDFPDESYPQLIPGAGRQSQWQLLRLSGSELTLRLTDADGQASVWTFRKW